MLTIFSLPGIRLKRARIIHDKIIFDAHTKAQSAACSCCKTKSSRVHSFYTRTLQDLPVSGYQVLIELQVRKFFCINNECVKKIFTEQPSIQIAAYSRKTTRAINKLQNLLIEVSANKGASLAQLMNMPVSSSTALRLVEKIPLPLIQDVNALGVDDWAIRKGLSYGTILVDIDRQKIIDILPGRDGSGLSNWLQNQSNIKIVTRDRSGAFSKAIKESLPDASQIADRFHLFKNLSDCVYQVIKSEYRNLANSLSDKDIITVYSQKETQKVVLTDPSKHESHYSKRFEVVKQMIKDGNSLRAISRTLKMSRNSIRKYLQINEYSKCKSHKNNYMQYQQVINDSLGDGVTIKETFDKIKKMGFDGKLSSFYNYIKQYKPEKQCSKAKLSIIKFRMLSPRKISIFLSLPELSKIENSSERSTITELLRNNSFLNKIRNQILAFKQMIQLKDVSKLNDWLKNTLEIGKPPLKTFVRGIKMDLEAVQNAISTHYSNGLVEGMVNKLKTLKRQMYGRASFELLKKKIILCTSG